jgi:hypothetical protein
METTELLVEGGAFVRALERVLSRHGYRIQRSFDKRLDSGTASQAAQAQWPCQCGCGYTVLLVFPDTPNASLEGTITILGIADRSVVSLLTPDNDGELTAQFPTILVEAMGLRGEGGKACRCDPV